MKNILLVSATLFLLSCEQKTRPSRYILSNSYEKISQTKDINYLIEYAKKLRCVCSTSIGIEGAYNPDGEYFERLNELASDSLLISLTSCSSPNLRVSSFLELERRNSKMLPDIIERLSKDSSEVCFISNDVEIPSTVGHTVLLSKSRVDK